MSSRPPLTGNPRHDRFPDYSLARSVIADDADFLKCDKASPIILSSVGKEVPDLVFLVHELINTGRSFAAPEESFACEDVIGANPIGRAHPVAPRQAHFTALSRWLRRSSGMPRVEVADVILSREPSPSSS